MTLRDKLETVGLTLAIMSAMFGTICAFAAGLSRSGLRALVVASLLGALPVTAHAEDYDRSRLGVANFAAGTVFVFLSAADKVITYKALTQHKGREVGPILAPWVEAHGVKSAMIGGLALDMGQAAGMAYIAKRWPRSKKAVFGGFVAANVVKVVVVAHNKRVLRGAR